jgi:hypothetical protein
MRKNLFLALTLFMMSVASMNAQVRKGVEDVPDASAILELRSSNLGLLLPQVQLDAIDDEDHLAAAAVNGLLVCNTEGNLPYGVYYWSNSQWVLFIKF